MSTLIRGFNNRLEQGSQALDIVNSTGLNVYSLWTVDAAKVVVIIRFIRFGE